MSDPAIRAFESLIGDTVVAASILGGMNKVGSALTKTHYYWLNHSTGRYEKEPR